MHRQFKPDPNLQALTCTSCGKEPHFYNSPRGVFIECSPCGRRTDALPNETLASYDWQLDRFYAIGKAA
jgi:hypothetical protein